MGERRPDRASEENRANRVIGPAPCWPPPCSGGAGGLLAQATTVTCASKPASGSTARPTPRRRRHLRVDRRGRLPAGKDVGLRRRGRLGRGRLRRRVPAGPRRTVGAAAPAPRHRAPRRRRRPQGPKAPYVPVETWGEFDPGKGFLVGRGSAGELAISGYALVRYVNQMPGEQTFTDHLGNERTVDGRNDIWPHRVMVFLKGWLGTPKLVYTVTFWTVLDTNQNAIFGNLGYQFSRKFSVYAGLNGNPGIALAPGVAPLLARPRSRDGRRVLPALLQLRRLGPGRTRARPLVQRDAGQHQQHPRRQVEPAGPQLHDRRLGVVDAHHEGVRPPGRLRRLGAAREGGHPVRRLHDAAAPSSASPIPAAAPTTPRSGWPTA